MAFNYLVGYSCTLRSQFSADTELFCGSFLLRLPWDNIDTSELSAVERRANEDAATRFIKQDYYLVDVTVLAISKLGQIP